MNLGPELGDELACSGLFGTSQVPFGIAQTHWKILIWLSLISLDFDPFASLVSNETYVERLCSEQFPVVPVYYKHSKANDYSPTLISRNQPFALLHSVHSTTNRKILKLSAC